MKKLLACLLILAIIGGMFWFSYGGYFRLNGDWRCVNIANNSVLSFGANAAAYFGAAAQLHFKVDIMGILRGQWPMRLTGDGLSIQLGEGGYQVTGNVIVVGDVAMRYRVKDDVLTLSNAAGDLIAAFERVKK